MKSRVFIYPLIIIISLVQGRNLPFELKTERRFSGVEIIPTDINLDKVDELLKISKNNIQLFDQKGRFYWDFYFNSFVLKTITASDYDQDGLKELFLTHSDGLNEIIEYYRPADNLEFIKRFSTVKGIDRNHDGKWDGGVTAIGGIDANDDGKFDLLLNVGCSFDLQPRGLAVYDLETGKELWHYWIGPPVDKVILEDLNHDGNQEIVIGTYSTANGSEANNTSDTKSYVIVLNRKGQLLWEKQIGESFTFSLIAVANIDQDSTKGVIVAQSTRKQGKEDPDKLVIYDGQNGKEKRLINTGENFLGLTCADLDHNAIDEMITGNSNGEIKVFNTSLDEILTFKNNTDIEVMGSYDLNGDGLKEIIATTEDNKLKIFNQKLIEIAQIKLENNILDGGFNTSSAAVITVKFQKERKLLVRAANKEESDFVLYQFYPAPLVKQLNYFTLILLFIIILALVHSFTFYRLWTYTVNVAKRYYSKVNEIGYIILNSKGKVRVANKRSETLLGIDNLEDKNLLKKLTDFGLNEIYYKIQNLRQFENKEVTIRKGEEGEKVLSLNFYKMPLPGIFTLRIEDVTKYQHLARIESWTPVAQKLAHGIKTPLMNIQLSVQQLEADFKSGDDKTLKKIENINDEMTRLSKLADSFMKFTKLSQPNFKTENINEIIKGLVARYTVSLPASISIKLDLNEEIPKLLVDRQEIENAFTIIMNNAVESLTRTGNIKIITSSFQRFEGKIRNWVQIIFADSGKGIPEKYLKNVFDPYFVYDKPNGTGLGLPLAKRIIENHNGTIEINSKEDIGTIVTINLPLNLGNEY